MKVPSEQIELKKKVGKSKGKDLWYYKLRGGLHLITDQNGVPLGTGPHRAVARHIAQKYEPDLVWTELSKGEHFEVKDFEHLLPEWEAVTAAVRSGKDKK